MHNYTNKCKITLIYQIKLSHYTTNMPELPEIETIRRGMSPELQGKTVSEVIVRNGNLRWPVPQDLDKTLINQTVMSISRRGKYLLFDFKVGTLLIHLGMSGYLRILDKSMACVKHDNFDIVFTDGKALRLNDSRRFGAVLWTQNPQWHPLLKHLGPEPLEALSPRYLADKAKKSSVAIKQFLMDSHIVVGVGNIYANEALFLAGVHPQKSAKNLKIQDWERVTAAIVHTLTLAIESGGTTLKDFRDSTGKPGYFQQKLKVYGREGESCYTCGSLLNGVRLSGRATVFCPRCQRKK